MNVVISGEVVCLLRKKQTDGTERLSLQLSQVDQETGYHVVNISVKDFNGYEVGDHVEVKAKVGLFVSDRGKAFLTVKGA